MNDRPHSDRISFSGVEAVGLSHVGQVRGRNEDSFVVDEEGGLAVVADGMGGLPAGDLASRLAAEEMAQRLKGVGLFEGSPTEDELVAATRLVSLAVQYANQRVLQAASEVPGRNGMGTTVTAVKVLSQDGTFLVAHVGDSRAYQFSEGGLSQITRDQTWVQTQVDAGTLDPRHVRDHPYGHMLVQVVGMEGELDPQLTRGQLQVDEVLLLCTDGLIRVLEDSDLRETLAEARSRGLGWAADHLVDVANERGAPDNVTVALLRLRG